MAWNELSCEYEYDAVGKLIRGVKTDLVELRGEGWTVRCSCEHPFLLADRTWRTADALKEGDHLMAEAARSLRVLSFRRLCLSEGVEVYNFGVSRTHTYCVTERAIVVHNKLVY